MEKDPIVGFAPAFKGLITIPDLLNTEGTFTFTIDRHSIQAGGFLFQFIDNDFIFCLGFQNNSIVFQRNETVSVLTLDDILDKHEKVGIFAIWSHDKLTLDCGVGESLKRAEVPTTPTAPTTKLIKWARKNSLVPTEIYKTEEELREKIHTCLLTINQKIREADAYKSFWNISYKGNTITARKPKKEVEIQPLIHCFLSDQMLLSNIEIIPEHKTGEGNLDFLFIGSVEDTGLCKFCAEFKLAHSTDLDNGLWHQLPKYMDVSNAAYGAYCVLDFKGDWFDKPVFKDGMALDIHLSLIPDDKSKPVHKNIRSFIFNLAKPTTASKKL